MNEEEFKKKIHDCIENPRDIIFEEMQVDDNEENYKTLFNECMTLNKIFLSNNKRCMTRVINIKYTDGDSSLTIEMIMA